jgi:hypothetical protein
MDQTHIEGFLESAVGTIKRPSAAVGGVMVEAKSDVIPDGSEICGLANEFSRFIQQEATKPADLGSPQGHPIVPLDDFPLLKKYLNAVTLYGSVSSGSWVQVAPFGDAAEYHPGIGGGAVNLRREFA